MLVAHCGVGKRKRKKSLEILFDRRFATHLVSNAKDELTRWNIGYNT